MRNICAHHSRLWNLNVVEIPKLPSKNEVPWIAPFVEHDRLKSRPFLLFCIAKHLMNTINPNSTWWVRLTNLMHTELPDMTALGLDLNSMGVAEDWSTMFSETKDENQ